MMAQQNGSACSLLKQEPLAWASTKPETVRDHADVVAANLRILEREGMPADPTMRLVFADNIKRLAKVAGSR